jgi:hypothetical protein
MAKAADMSEIPQMPDSWAHPQRSPCLGCLPAAIIGASRGASSMRALICRQWGGIEQLQIGEAPMPRPGRDEVLIRVKATAVNYADAIMVAGLWLLKTPNC